MITLGRNLGLDVVAEGVELTEQALVLRTWGCHKAQGFHFGMPMPLEEAIKAWRVQPEKALGAKYSQDIRPTSRPATG